MATMRVEWKGRIRSVYITISGVMFMFALCGNTCAAGKVEETGKVGEMSTTSVADVNHEEEVDEEKQLSKIVSVSGLGASIVTKKEYRVLNDNFYKPASDMYLRADFNGDGLEDYAALLRFGKWNYADSPQGKRKRSANLRLVVFLARAEKGERVVMLAVFKEQNPGRMILRLVPPGKNLICEFRDESARHKYPAIFCGFQESATMAFYWDEKQGKFLEIYLSD